MLLLGDELIRDPIMAVFELVKNAYDADSPKAKITMRNLDDPDSAVILVKDSGTGMNPETVRGVWLEPGTDFRKNQREQQARTKIHRRLPLGEKGVGRFAVHKLGDRIQLITRSKGKPEILVSIDWRDFSESKYLNDVEVDIKEREPEFFTDGKTGTIIKISALRHEWTRAMVRKLSRAITSICSPFGESGDFTADLVLPEQKDWLKNLLSYDDVLELALFQGKCTIRKGSLSYEYQFKPYSSMAQVKGRTVTKKGMRLPVEEELPKNYFIDFDLEINIFDREPRILELGVSDKQGLKQVLDQAGGVRVYLDGVRVFDYGEPGNDWLDLGGRRVNIPSRRISNNIVLGAVLLTSEHLLNSVPVKSEKRVIEEFRLREKTNREGFVENAAYNYLKEAVIFVLQQIENERNQDKERIRALYAKTKSKGSALDIIQELRIAVKKAHVEKQLKGYIDRIERDYIEIRDRFLVSASAGLSLSVVIHEIEKGVRELAKTVEIEKASQKVLQLTKHVAELVEGFASLMRGSSQTKQTLEALVSQATLNTKLRLRAHKITLEKDLQSSSKVLCSRRLVVSTIMNLIDNSIWWLDAHYGLESKEKRILLATRETRNECAIIVADNGPGFSDPSEFLTKPFFSRRPDGMGLGLHIASEVMKAHGGLLEVGESDISDIPDEFTGAVVTLIFKLSESSS